MTAHLKVVPTIRSVTVSPDSVNFGSCQEGSGDTASAGDQLGYPNGICWVGDTGSNGHFPVTVTYTGLAGNVWVHAENAVSGQRQLEPVRSDRSWPAPATRTTRATIRSPS